MPPNRTSVRAVPRRRPVALLVGVAALTVVGLAGYAAVHAWHRSAARSAALAGARGARAAEALPALRACLDRDPDDAEALDAVVAAMSRSGALAVDIEPYLDRLCALQPDNAEALRSRFEMRAKFGRYEEALADARHILTLHPDDHSTRKTAANLSADLGRHDEAQRDIATLLESSSVPKPELGTLLARIHREKGEPAEALEALARYLPPGTAFPPGLVLRGVLLYDAGRYEEAVAVLREAAPKAVGPDRENALSHLALSLARLGRGDEARRTFDLLNADYLSRRLATDAKHRPDDLPAQIRAARANLDAGNADAARQLVESAVARLGGSADAFNTLADCYERLGQPAAAAAARRAAAGGGPIPH